MALPDTEQETNKKPTKNELIQRAGAAGLLVLALVLAWIGQGKLRQQSPDSGVGWVIIILAVLILVSLNGWTRYNEDSSYQMSMKKLIVWCSPTGAALFVAGVVVSLLAFWLHLLPGLLSWVALVAWLAGMALAVAGAVRFGAIQHLRPPPVESKRPSSSPISTTGSRSIPFSRGKKPDDEPAEVADETTTRLAGRGGSVGISRPRESSTISLSSRPRASSLRETPRQVPSTYGQDAPVAEGDVPETESPTLSGLWQKMLTYQVYAWLISSTLFGLVLRLWQIGNNSLSNHEQQVMQAAQQVIRGEIVQPFGADSAFVPNLWLFVQTLGMNLAGGSHLGMRVLSALVGTLTIPALYYLVRKLFSHPTALATAIVLATSPLHILASSQADGNVAIQPVMLLVFAVLLSGWASRASWSFLLAGILCGLTWHLAVGGWLIMAILLVALLHQWLVNQSYVISLKGHLALLIAGVMMGIGPLLLSVGEVAQRAMTPASLPMVSLAKGSSSILMQFITILAVFGMALVLMRWQNIESVLLLAWGIVVVGVGSMLDIAPTHGVLGYSLIVPLVCLLVVLAIEYLAGIIRWIIAIPPERQQVVGWVLIGNIVLWSMTAFLG